MSITLAPTVGTYLALFFMCLWASGYSDMAASKSPFERMKRLVNPLQTTSAVRLLPSPPLNASKLKRININIHKKFPLTNWLRNSLKLVCLNILIQFTWKHNNIDTWKLHVSAYSKKQKISHQTLFLQRHCPLWVLPGRWNCLVPQLHPPDPDSLCTSPCPPLPTYQIHWDHTSIKKQTFFRILVPNITDYFFCGCFLISK